MKLRSLVPCLLISVPLIISSCTTPLKLPQRYNSCTSRNYDAGKDSIRYFVGINGYATSLNKPKEKKEEPKNIFSLSPEGQKQLIESIADNEKVSDDIFVKLSEKIGEEKSEISRKDVTKFRRRLVFSVDNLCANPADRITKLSVSLSLNKESGIIFTSCNKVSNGKQTIDIGKQDYGNVSRLQALHENDKPVVETPKTGASNNSKHSPLRHKPVNFDTQVTTPARQVSLSSYITPNSLNYAEDNANGSVVMGNIIADASFEYKGEKTVKTVYSFTNLQNRDRTNAKPADIVTNQKRLIYPAVSKDVVLSLSYEATVRHVVNGANTISESDDDVEMITGKASENDILLVSRDQFIPAMWAITDGVNNLEIDGPLKQNTLLFDSYENAMNFILWLKRSSSEVLMSNKLSNGDYQLSISGSMSTLTDSFIKNCTVKML